MRKEIKNHGLVVEDVLAGLDSTHYLLGSSSKLGTEIIQGDGNWLPYIPKFEQQYTNNYDTYGCTCFGTLNALELLMKKLYGGDYDYAERFPYILAGIRAPGGDPHKVIEIIRTKGLVGQAVLPLTETYEQFIQPDPMDKAILAKGQEFLKDKEIGHEWIFTNTPNTADRVSMLKYALQRGSVAISVTAWYQDEDGLYIDNGQQNTHWVCLVDIEEGADGKFYPVIIDSYDLIMNGVSTAYKKKLHPDHKITMAKRYSITPKAPSIPMTDAQKKNIFDYIGKMIEFIKQALGLIQIEVDQLPKPPQPTTPPVVVTVPFPAPEPAPKYLWDTKTNIRHSVRVICDEEGLDVEQKNTMCATVQAESGFVLTANNENKVNGKTVSTDWGLAQWNDYYHGKEITPEEAVNNPEKAIRLMCAYWKRGQRNLWIAYKNGSYKKFL